MKKLRWQLLIIFLTGLVVGILLLNEQPEPVFSPNGPGPAATEEPVQGGVYTEALVGSLVRLNPLLVLHNGPDREISRLVFAGLVKFDGKGAPQPDLAEAMGHSMDGTLYNFTLRQDAQWHDGEPVTADDVVFTIDLIRQGGGAVPVDLQDFWDEVELVQLSDDTLQFRLPEPFSPFYDYLTFGILPKHLLDGQTLETMIDSPFNLQPIGAGPYRFNQMVVENGEIKGVALSAFEDYYAQKPYIEQVIFLYYPDAASALQAYRDGRVQGIGEVTTDILKPVLAEPDLAVYTAREPQLSMILFNLKNQDTAYLQDVNVRKALLQGINRQWIVDRILQSQAAVADGPILPDTWAYYNDLKREAYDPEAAKALLIQAGFVLAEEGDVVRRKEDVSLRFTMLYPDDEHHQAIAEYIRTAWAALGVQVELEPVPYDILIRDRLETRDYQAALVDLNLSRSPDPDPYPFWDQAQATGGQNYTQWDSRVASEYLEQARIAAEMTDRTRLYRNFQIVFARELPALPLYYPMYTYAVDQNVRGVRVGPLFDTADRFFNITEWYLETERNRPQNAVAPSQ